MRLSYGAFSMKRIPSCCLLAFCLFFASTFAAATCTLTNSKDCAYIASATGEQILAVDRTATGATPFVVRNLNNGETADGTLTVGPDNKLYVALFSSNRIIRMDLNGANRETVSSGLTGPYGLKFNAKLDLLVSTKGASASGIYRIPGAANVATGGSFSAPVSVFSSTIALGGMALAPNGDLLVAQPSSGNVLRFVAQNNYAPASNPLITGRSFPISLAVDTAGKIYVAEQGAGLVTRCKADGTCDNSPFVTFDPLDVLNDINITLDKTLYAATGGDGKLWRITGANTKVTAGILVKTNGKIPPAVAVASAPSARTITFAEATQPDPNNLHRWRFSFESFLIEVTSPDLGDVCQIDVRAEQRPPKDIKSIVEASPGTTGKGLQPIPLDGQYGFLIGFTLLHNCTSNELTDVLIAGLFTPAGTPLNPRGIKMPDLCSTQLCNQAILGDLSANYLTGPFELFGPTDPGVGNIYSGKSEFFLVHQPIQPIAPNVVVNFCGILPPVNPDGSSSFKSGQSITFKFQAATNCANADATFVPNLFALLSAVRFSTQPNGQGNVVWDRIIIGDKGQSVPPQPLFRPQGTQYVFPFDTTGLPKGTYEWSVTANNFPAQKGRFNIK
jgi:hypothetical protein